MCQLYYAESLLQLIPYIIIYMLSILKTKHQMADHAIILVLAVPQCQYLNFMLRRESLNKLLQDVLFYCEILPFGSLVSKPYHCWLTMSLRTVVAHPCLAHHTSPDNKLWRTANADYIKNVAEGSGGSSLSLQNKWWY